MEKQKKASQLRSILLLKNSLQSILLSNRCLDVMVSYVKDKIVLILRSKEGVTNDNGVWIATTHEHHESLRKDFPSMRTISVFGGTESGWQNLPADDENFEEAVMKVCRLIMKGDPRIGKTPKPRKKKG